MRAIFAERLYSCAARRLRRCYRGRAARKTGGLASGATKELISRRGHCALMRASAGGAFLVRVDAGSGGLRGWP